MKKKMKLILLMATALIGVSQDQGLLTTPVENNHVVLADTKSKSKTTKKDDKATKAAKKAVKQLEKDQTQENLDLATTRVKAVKIRKSKT